MADRREPIPVDPVDVGELSELDNLAHLAAHVSFKTFSRIYL